MLAVSTKRRLVVGLVALLVTLAVLSFVLPYVGAGDSGLSKLFP